MNAFSIKSPLTPLNQVPLTENEARRIRDLREKRLATPSEIELAVIDIFETIRSVYGIWYSREQPFVISPEIFFFVDFWLPTMRVAVEIDGPEHFKGKRNNRKVPDLYRMQLIRRKKVSFLRFKNQDIVDAKEKFISRMVKHCLYIGDKKGRKFLVQRLKENGQWPWPSGG